MQEKTIMYAVFANTIAEKVELAKAEKIGLNAILNGEELDRRFMMAWTKEKRAEYMKRYRAEHKDEINLRVKKWRMANPDKEKAIIDRWREAHREQYNTYQREYHREYRKRKAVEQWG